MQKLHEIKNIIRQTHYFRYFTMATNCRITVASVYSLDNTGLPTNVTCSVTVIDSGGLSDTSSLVIRIGIAIYVIIVLI